MFDVRRFLAHSLQFFVICSVHSIQNVEPLAEKNVNCTKMHRKEKVMLMKLMKTKQEIVAK